MTLTDVCGECDDFKDMDPDGFGHCQRIGGYPHKGNHHPCFTRGDRMKVLRFNREVFHDGVNYTVRIGFKWGILVGERFRIALGKTAICTHLHICRFCDLPDYIIAAEHDPACVTRAGLWSALVSYYGSLTQPTDVVTAIGFECDVDGR